MKKIPFNKLRRAYNNGIDKGYDKRDKQARKERAELEARDERRASEHKERIDRASRIIDEANYRSAEIIKNAKDEAAQIIAKAENKSSEVIGKANEKLIDASDVYEKIKSLADNSDEIFQKTFSAHKDIKYNATIAKGIAVHKGIGEYGNKVN